MFDPATRTYIPFSEYGLTIFINGCVVGRGEQGVLSIFMDNRGINWVMTPRVDPMRTATIF